MKQGEKKLENISKDQTVEMQETQVTFTDFEKNIILQHIEGFFRHGKKNLTDDFADAINNIYRKLTGSDHEVWTNLYKNQENKE